jgi:hypothetical protein
LEILNVSFFLYSKTNGSWIRQTPGEYCRLFIYNDKKRYGEFVFAIGGVFFFFLFFCGFFWLKSRFDDPR